MLLLGALNRVLAVDSLRERLSFDANWKFHLGDGWGLGEKLDKAGQSSGPARMNFSDTDWRTLNLPHDWVVELPFDATADVFHGSKPVGPGFSTNNVGWYRHTFTLPAADQDKRLWLEFDGVYRDCRIYLNGFKLAHHESGYNSFRCDITDLARCGGENVLAVRVDAAEFEGWFYEGAGIYRHVWLVKTAPLAVAPDGIFVRSSFPDNVPGDAATIHLETQLLNSQNDAALAEVDWQLLDPAGNVVANARQSKSLDAWETSAAEQTALVSAPRLWSPESPQLYQLVTTVKRDGKITDRVRTEFGIRTVAFDSTNGFLLNGKRYVIKGTCNHQDAAGVGVALPDALQTFRIKKLKEMGDNAIRTAHHEPTAELLEACDRLGMLVMDENRLLGSDAQNLAGLEQHIRRDRNHPSVFIWSLCNEEGTQRERVAGRIFGTMQTLVHRLDPSRLCTAAMNSWSSGRPQGFSTVMDVQGFNYLNNGDMDGFHRSNPARPVIGTEEASAFYTRGIYENTAHYKSAYDDNKPGYGATAEEWWQYYFARPWASGSFVWTGFDYRGEPSPFGWPNISSEFGILDTCGFPKDIFYYYQSWWTTNVVLHLMPHWNWAGREGQVIDVRCFSNCQEVELFLNGRSLGRKTMPRNSHLQWPVKYAPGMLSAQGYSGGKLVAEEKMETTGVAAALQLVPDRARLRADGTDVSVVTVTVADGQGRVVPTADDLVHFELSGPGKIIGVGNGDPVCHEPDVFVNQPLSHGMKLDGWRMQKISDAQSRAETAVEWNDASWPAVKVQSNNGPLQPGEAAVFRAHAHLTTADLAADQATLKFGLIDDDGWVYVNGQFAGESHDWQSSPAFAIRNFLRAGDNVIAVVVHNGEGSGGLGEGVTLALTQPTQVAWQRSAFNGRAQILVQADEKAGEIKLRAHAAGLVPATLVIHSRKVDDEAAK